MGHNRYWDGQQWTEKHNPLINTEPAYIIQGPNHVLHLILSLLTCGLWLIVWLFIALSDKRTVRRVYVD